MRRVAAAIYDFVVGDDWRAALGAMVAVAAAAGLAAIGLPGWCVLPALVIMALWWSAGRAVRG